MLITNCYIKVALAPLRAEVAEVFIRHRLLPDGTYLGIVPVTGAQPHLPAAKQLAVDAGWTVRGQWTRQADWTWTVDCDRPVPQHDPAGTGMPRT